MLRNATTTSICILLLAACSGREGADTDAAHRVKSSDLSEEDAKSVHFVKSVADHYKELAAARDAGYSVQYPEGCVQQDGGAQGVHFGNPLLLDGRAEMNRPELLVFEPQSNGSMVLVGVNYVIPFEHWKDKDPPQLIGRRFMRNEKLQAWDLHIWTHRTNPNGVFAMSNPNVTCRSARARAVPASAQPQ